jgi:hypothetical protein
MWENYAFGGPTDDWWQRYVYDSTQRGLDILGSRYGQGQYISPDDPRYRQQGGYYPSGGYPGSPANVPAGYVPGTVNTQGFQLNWWTVALLGLVGGAFLFGRKGR